MFWRKIEFLFEEGVVKVQNIDLFGTSLKILIPFVRRVQITILFKYLPVEPHVTGVQDSPHVAFYQYQYAPNTMISVKKSDSHGQTRRHLDFSWSLQG
jgi:hypothetical protein